MSFDGNYLANKIALAVENNLDHDLDSDLAHDLDNGEILILIMSTIMI